MQNVVLFRDALGADKFLLGGKGYGLAEMTSLGLPVPPGFTITTQVCKEYYANGGKVPDGLFELVRAKISDVEKQTGKKFGGEEKPLLFSVRSGAPFSMPGMMDTILNLGLNDVTAKRMAEITKNERFAYDSYRRLIQMFGKIAMGADAEEFEKVLEARRKATGAKMDIDLSPQELRGVAEEFKLIIKEGTGKEFPQDPYVQLEMAVVAVLGSWNNDRAKEYRKFYSIPDDLGTAPGRRIGDGAHGAVPSPGPGSSTTGLVSTPTPSTSTSTTSPATSQRGGSDAAPTPAGVPVASTVCGSSVATVDRWAIISATVKIMSDVVPSWRTSPLTRVRTRNDWGSGISSAVTTHGPTGPWVSNPLPSSMVGVDRCQSRTLTSFTTVYPATTSRAPSTGTCRHRLPMTTPSSPS